MKNLMLGLMLGVFGVILILYSKRSMKRSKDLVKGFESKSSDTLTINVVALNSKSFENAFNTMSSANEVREWINLNHSKYGFFNEWPRGGGQGEMIRGMQTCIFAKELEQDVKKIEESWYLGKMPWLILTQ
jgi:hypothetical protein